MGEPIPQIAFSAGEVSPLVYERFDIEKFAQAAKRLENVIVREQGGVTLRPGTRHVALTPDQTGTIRLAPFEESANDTMLLEFTVGRLRLVQDGGYILDTEASIDAIFNTNPLTVQTSLSAAIGDRIWIQGVEAPSAVNGIVLEVTGVTPGFLEVALDGSGLPSYTSGGTVARVYEVPTPLTSDDVASFRYAQSNDEFSLAMKSRAPLSLIRADTTDWSIESIDFTTQIAAPGNVVARGININSKATQVPTGQNGRYAVAAVFDDGSETDLGISNNIQFYGNWTVDDAIEITWNAVPNALYYRIYQRRNNVYGLVGEAEELQFIDINYTRNTAEGPRRIQDPFTEVGKYPLCVTYFRQRRGWCNTDELPNAYWFTTQGQYNRIATARPLRDDDAIVLTLDAQSRNEIRHMLAGDALLYFTPDAVWRLDLDGEGFSTATAANFDRAAGIGAADPRPIELPVGIGYVEAGGRRIRLMDYELSRDGYIPRDLSVLATHLFDDRTVVDWAYDRTNSVFYIVCDDGSVVALTHNTEHGITGFTRLDLGGTADAVAVVREDNVDRVYFAIWRTVGGTSRRAIERMTLLDEVNWEASVHLDASVTQVNTAVVTSGRNLDQVIAVSAPFRTVLGLWHLEGEAVEALADGVHITGLTVAQGQVELPAEVNIATVGKPVQGTVVTLPRSRAVAGEARSGARRKVIPSVGVHYHNARRLRVGHPDRPETVQVERHDGFGMMSPKTGTRMFTVPDSWSEEESVAVELIEPIPTTITGIVPSVEMGR
ncbi:MAG: hypothetical protein AAF844_00170 [Pseudomonadota bacterium]